MLVKFLIVIYLCFLFCLFVIALLKKILLENPARRFNLQAIKSHKWMAHSVGG